MKPETKKSLFFLFLTIAYSLQAIVNAYKFSYIYFLGFMCAVALVYVIRNKYIGALAGMVVLLSAELYDTNYKCLTVLAFLLICAHKNLMSDTGSDEKKKNKKDTNGFSFACVQLSVFATVALLIYDFILITKSEINSYAISFSRAVVIMFCLIGIFVYSIFKSNKDKKQKNSHKINKQLSGSLRFMYLVNIFSFLATVLFSYAKIGFIHMSYNAVFFPWFVYICSMVYNSDPYIDSLADAIKAKLTKISYKYKVEE